MKIMPFVLLFFAMVTIILLRHGQNEWVKKGRLAGWIPNVHLNETGHQQAQDAAQRLAKLPVKAVYSSPVLRCMETAHYVAQQFALPIQELPAMGEVRYGQWEGQKIKSLAKKPEWKAVQHTPSRFRFPEGESFAEVQHRAVQALDQLSTEYKDETIVVCSHADVIKLVVAYYSGMHMDLFQRIIISPASVSIVHLAPNLVRVSRINDNGPLAVEMPAKKKKSKNKKSKSS